MDVFIPLWLFQFTHPGGVRLSSSLMLRVTTGFNSRTREGCDLATLITTDVTQTVSIHAPGRGATIIGHELFGDITVSIHAPGRGATFTTTFIAARIMFQFTHPGGVRRDKKRMIILRHTFQFTHPGGVRLSLISATNKRSISFNSRTREGCDYCTAFKTIRA